MTESFVSHFFLNAIRALLAAALALSLSHQAFASPETPNLAEVSDLYVALDFRNRMIEDPADAAIKAGTHSARAALEAMTAAFTEAGSGTDGWGYLLGASVFSAVAVGEPITFVMFYNPWVDAALVTEWEDLPDGRNLLDAEWMPGDILRGEDINLPPPWLRGIGHPSIVMMNILADTIDAFEAKFGDERFAANWRGGLGLENREDVATYLSPLIALRTFENQMRLKAIAVSTENEDPLLMPIREAVVDLIATAVTEGFEPLLALADQTPRSMVQTLAMIQPETMQGLSPIAYVVDEDELLMYFASPLTTDFVLAAVYERDGTALRLRVLDFIAYAATYEAVRAQARTGPELTPPPRPDARKGGLSGGGKVIDLKKK